MFTKVVMHRKAKLENQAQMLPLLAQLRDLASSNLEYLGGETFISKDDPTKTVVISTWKSDAAWEKYKASKERVETQALLDAILEKPTTYEVYYSVGGTATPYK